MIRSARIPNILSRIITKGDPVIQTVLLVTADGELLGSTSSTFTNTSGISSSSTTTAMTSNGTSPENSNNNTISIEHLGALIADIAVDYQQLGDVMGAGNTSGNSATRTTSTSGIDGGAAASGSNPASTTMTTAPATATTTSLATNTTTEANNNNNNNPSSSSATTTSTTTAPNSKSTTANTNKSNKKSTTLLLELEQGLVGVSSCLDCWIIAIATTPNAPVGMLHARLQALTEYVQEALSPLTETVMDR